MLSCLSIKIIWRLYIVVKNSGELGIFTTTTFIKRVEQSARVLGVGVQKNSETDGKKVTLEKNNLFSTEFPEAMINNDLTGDYGVAVREGFVKSGSPLKISTTYYISK